MEHHAAPSGCDPAGLAKRLTQSKNVGRGRRIPPALGTRGAFEAGCGDPARHQEIASFTLQTISRLHGSGLAMHRIDVACERHHGGIVEVFAPGHGRARQAELDDPRYGSDAVGLPSGQVTPNLLGKVRWFNRKLHGKWSVAP